MADNEVRPALVEEKLGRLGDQLAASAYYALWGLYELDPQNESADFRSVRLALDRGLCGSADHQVVAAAQADQPRLRLVRGPGGS